MELYIETLTGAAFELRVSPFETIMSVKAKIQRLEGNLWMCFVSLLTKEKVLCAKDSVPLLI